VPRQEALAVMANFLDMLFSGQDYRTTAPQGGYADLYQGGLLARNRDQMPISVQGAQASQDFMPGIGDVLALKDAYDAASRGDKVAAGLLGAGAAIGLVPGAGKVVARPVMAAGRKVADLADRIEVDPNAFGSMGGNVRLRPQADGMPSLPDVLAVRAEQMALKPADRIQPAQGGAGIFDRDYATSAPSGILPDLSERYVRNPDPSSPLPKGDRARVLVDKADQVADLLAERIRATGQMDADTRYFYHTDGPVYRAATKAGLSDDEAAKYLADLGDYVAATSPRTKVEENLRNASLVMAKQAQGIPFREIIGPGTVDPKTGVRGISEKGYPLMTGKGGIHGNLLDDVIESGGMNVANNPKPSNFGPNIAGNRSGVTVDTHAIRGTLQTLNEMEPGAVPEGFILPKFREAYKSDPSVLTPNMIDDTLAGQMIGPKGNTTKAQTEYAIFADIWHKAADRLGVSPAEAQSMGWFGFGDETNLGSARKTPVDIFDERIDVTAKAMGISPEKTAEGVFRRQIPLLGVGGLGLLSTMPEQEQQPQGLLQ
jgi:hypothetical protein